MNLVKIEKFSGEVLEIVRISSNSVNIGCYTYSSVKICGIVDYLPPIKMSKHKHYLIQIASCDVLKLRNMIFSIFFMGLASGQNPYTGDIWPQPQSHFIGQKVYEIDGANFKIVASSGIV